MVAVKAKCPGLLGVSGQTQVPSTLSRRWYVDLPQAESRTHRAAWPKLHQGVDPNKIM
jgi:hypothetical protein